MNDEATTAPAAVVENPAPSAATDTPEEAAATSRPAPVAPGAALDESGTKAPHSKAAPAILPGNVAPLWTTRDVARFLARSERWVYDALTCDPAKPGSLPSIRIPGGRGSHGQGTARFVPAEIQSWVAAGCPPASVFRTWQEAERKKKKS